MRALLAAAAIALMATPALAQDKPACQTLAQAEAVLKGHNETFVELDAKSLIGVDGENLGKMLVSTYRGAVVIGFELAGCMSAVLAVAPIVGAELPPRVGV